MACVTVYTSVGFTKTVLSVLPIFTTSAVLLNTGDVFGINAE
jgi:hypothetical protein